jgi:hypothetical protein
MCEIKSKIIVIVNDFPHSHIHVPTKPFKRLCLIVGALGGISSFIPYILYYFFA